MFWLFSYKCDLNSLYFSKRVPQTEGSPGGKESTCLCRRHRKCGFDPWVRKTLRGGNGNPLQYSCLKNPMDRGAWQATVHRVTKSQTRLSTHTPKADQCDLKQDSTLLIQMSNLSLLPKSISYGRYCSLETLSFCQMSDFRFSRLFCIWEIESLYSITKPGIHS